MKTNLYSKKVILYLIIFISYSLSITSAPINKLIDRKYPKTGSKYFVVFNDGSIKSFSSLKLVTGLFKTPHLLADGNQVIYAGDIKAYQNQDHYAISEKEFSASKKPSKVAKDALPGFAVRVASGKINVYSLKYYNGQNATEKFFLQVGDDGQIVAFTNELFNDLIKDNNEALVYFNDKKQANSINKKLLLSVDIYNNTGFISKN